MASNPVLRAKRVKLKVRAPFIRATSNPIGYLWLQTGTCPDICRQGCSPVCSHERFLKYRSSLEYVLSREGDKGYEVLPGKLFNSPSRDKQPQWLEKRSSLHCVLNNCILKVRYCENTPKLTPANLFKHSQLCLEEGIRSCPVLCRLTMVIRRYILAVTVSGLIAAQSGAVNQPGLNDDVGVEINQTEVLVYPFSMTLSGIMEGKALVVISVDATGQLNDALVVGYTKRAFADAAIGALRRWTYGAARMHGFARASRASVLFTFENGMGVMVQSLPALAESMALRSTNERYAYLACQLRDLDRIPIPIHVVPPAAAGRSLRGTTRTVTVEFYIDEDGRVRVPAIGRDEPDDAYAAAAVGAVEQWRFEPPVRKGRAVLVLARQDFSFVPKP